MQSSKPDNTLVHLSMTRQSLFQTLISEHKPILSIINKQIGQLDLARELRILKALTKTTEELYDNLYPPAGQS